jgi:hypothetical protein
MSAASFAARGAAAAFDANGRANDANAVDVEGGAAHIVADVVHVIVVDDANAPRVVVAGALVSASARANAAHARVHARRREDDSSIPTERAPKSDA